MKVVALPQIITLKSKWRSSTLGDICDRIDYGFTASADFSIKAPRLLRITDIQNGVVNWDQVPGCTILPSEESANRLADGDIVVARTGATTGKSFLIRKPPRSVFASYLIRLRTSEEVNSEFLSFFFQSENYWQQIYRNMRGAAQANVNASLLSSLVLSVPLIEDQKRISAVLAKADRLRRTRRYAQQLSDTFLQSVFVEMFGDPVKNPMRWSAIPVAELLAEGGIRTGPFGSSLKRHEYVEEGVPVWGINNVRENEFIEDDPLYITQSKYQELTNYAVSTGDILISRAGTVGRMCVARPTQQPSIIGTNLVKVSFNQSRILPEYFTAFFTYFAGKVGRLKTSSDDGAYSFLNPNNLKELLMILPCFDLQNKFLVVAQQFERLRAQQREATRQAEHLFQTLLHKAFTGCL